jgi:hypothetical protein
MSDEQRNEDEAEVEAHRRKKDANSEPPQDEDENDVEAHVRYSNVRMD